VKAAGAPTEMPRRMVKLDDGFALLLKRRIAEGAVGPSALRNQGNRNVIARARAFLAEMDLTRLVVRTEPEFRAGLDRYTEQLRKGFPPRAKNWGAARKALNLFLRDVLYNTYLSEHLGFASVEPWLEVPLDSYVVRGLASSYLRPLPKCRGIKHVTRQESAEFQKAARQVALANGVAPVHLDVYFWRDVGKPRGSGA
jgi:hypothetical protein